MFYRYVGKAAEPVVRYGRKAVQHPHVTVAYCCLFVESSDTSSSAEMDFTPLRREPSRYVQYHSCYLLPVNGRSGSNEGIFGNFSLGILSFKLLLGRFHDTLNHFNSKKAVL